MKSREVRGYELLKKETKEAGYFYHQNEHGDIIYLSNIAEEIENSYSYDVFGNVREQQENVENVFKYAGEQQDPETEQYYLRARFYNPVVGRFTQEDIYRGDGLNLYVYVINNPLLWVDSSGYAKCSGDSNINVNTNNNTNTLSSYYQDSNGRWHRPTGEFASNVEVGLPAPTLRMSNGIHGNSLSNTQTNYGYVLIDKQTKEILKFGESLYPKTRYSSNYLSQNNAKIIILETGNKLDIHNWQYDMNNYYKDKYGEYPPLEKSSSGY